MTAQTPTSADQSAPWTLTLCALAALGEGFDIQSMGVAAPQMAPALHLTHAQLGPLFSASVAGLLIGAIILGRVADRIGRKATLVASLAAFGLFSGATAVVTGYGPLLAVRLLAGLGLGGAMPNLIALSAEALAPAGLDLNRRTRMVTMVTAGMPLGGAVAGLTAVWLSWRGIFYLGAALPLVLAPVMMLTMPESPGFREARLRGPSGGVSKGALIGLFGPGRLATTLLLWAATFFALLSLYLLINWLPLLMRAKGVSAHDASLVSVLYNLGGALSALLLGGIVEARRRPGRLVVWYLGMALSIILLACVRADLASAGAGGFISGVFVASAALPFYGMAPGFYEIDVRGAGVGAALGVGRAGAIVGPLMAGALLAAGAGASLVILALLPLSLAIGAAALGLSRRPRVEDEAGAAAT